MISSRQFAELLADYQIEPWETDILNVNIARLLAAFLNVNRKKGKRKYSEFDFLPDTYKPEGDKVTGDREIFSRFKSYLFGDKPPKRGDTGQPIVSKRDV